MQVSNPAETIKALRRNILKASYYDFFKYFWPEISSETLIDNWHIKEICGELQKVGELVIKRLPKEYDLIINVPPGSSKSTMASVLFPVWLWVNDPTLQVISGCFSFTLSTKLNTDSREVLRSARFTELFPEIQIKKDEDAKTFYRTTQGGWRMATSAGSNITGNHAHLLLIDDPIDPKGVMSETILTGVNDWMDKTLSSRKVDKENTPTILIMQRLHELDPTGNWLQKAKEGKKKIRHVCLPAKADFEVSPPEYKEKYIDGLLDPIRLNETVLTEAKADLGSKDFAGQYGQSPRPTEGNIIKKDYLTVLLQHNIPADYRSLQRHIVADTAYKEKQQNDPSAFLSYFEHRGHLFISNFKKGKWAFPELCRQLQDFAHYEGAEQGRIEIEPKASGVSVVQTLRESTTLNVMEWEMMKGDKVERVNSVLPFLESGKVWLIQGAWNDDFISECLVFPNGAHDEAVDLLVMAAANVGKRKKVSGYSFFKAGEDL